MTGPSAPTLPRHIERLHSRSTEARGLQAISIPALLAGVARRSKERRVSTESGSLTTCRPMRRSPRDTRPRRTDATHHRCTACRRDPRLPLHADRSRAHEAVLRAAVEPEDTVLEAVTKAGVPRVPLRHGATLKHSRIRFALNCLGDANRLDTGPWTGRRITPSQATRR